MKLLLLVFAVCAVAKGTIQSSKLMDFEWYWRDWNVSTPIPEDAVAGGVDADGHPTYVAKSVYNKYGTIVPGKASPQAKKIWFESHRLEHTKTEDVEILCVLNERRLKWVATKYGDTVDKVVGDNVIIFGGNFAIGRQRIGNEIQVGKLLTAYGKFLNLYLCQNGRAKHVTQDFEVLLYVKDASDNS